MCEHSSWIFFSFWIKFCEPALNHYQQAHVALNWALINLTYCGLVMPYGDIDLGQHWLRQWLVAWCTKPLPKPILIYHITEVQWHSSGGILLEISQALISKIGLNITYIKFHPNLPGLNELSRCTWIWPICITIQEHGKIQLLGKIGRLVW